MSMHNLSHKHVMNCCMVEKRRLLLAVFVSNASILVVVLVVTPNFEGSTVPGV